MTGAASPLEAAFAAIRRGQPDAAAALLQPWLMANPQAFVGHLLLGEALMRMGRADAALAALTRALELAPDDERVRFALARLHYQCFDVAAALAVLRPLARRKPPLPDARHFYATLQAEAGDPAAALATIDSVSPRGAAALNRADLLRTLGRPDQAAAGYRAVLGTGGEAAARAWWGLAGMGGKMIADAEVEPLALAARREPEPERSVPLLFAAGKALEARGQHERAFAHFAAGNRIHRAGLEYDSAAFSRRMAQLGAAAARVLSERKGWGDPSPDPIFLVGMARSGSTLLERVLGGHRGVEACGEMPAIPALLRRTAGRLGIDPDREPLALLEALSEGDCAQLGREYLRLVAVRRKTGKARFIDKLPHNWAELLFIRMILPCAAVIDLRRAPHDCALSNFTLLFSPGHPSSYDLGEWCDYNEAYRGFVSAVEAARPGTILSARYEALVDDLAGETARVLDDLGLPFDPACLDFAQAGGPVATASAEQVRRPLNRDGIGSWRRYEPWLGAILPRLDAIARDDGLPLSSR
jgi:tetratricopeptide (TPR) repeat protein